MSNDKLLNFMSDHCTQKMERESKKNGQNMDYYGNNPLSRHASATRLMAIVYAAVR
jgi:hypothetical protein